MLTLAPSGHAMLRDALPQWERAQRAARKRLGSQNWLEIQQALADLTEGTGTSSTT